MNFENLHYLSGRAELLGTAIKPQPDGTTRLELDFDLEIPAPHSQADAMTNHLGCSK